MHFFIEPWIKQYVDAVQNQFPNRIWFLGLQGSYGRGEANEQSDIDVVLIFDTVSVGDLEAYSNMLDTLPNREKVCGFVSGKKELLAWEPSDLFQFCYDTTALMGSLDELISGIREEDIRRAIRIGACNVYHMCAHNLVHEKSMEILKSLYKSAFFTLQAIAFLQTGRYEKKKAALLPLLRADEQLVLKAGMELKVKQTLSPEERSLYSQRLLNWASKWICEVSYDGEIRTDRARGF